MKTPKIRFKGGNSRTEKFIKQIWKISTGKSNTQDQTEDWKYPFFIRSDIVVKSNKFLFNEEAVITIGDWNIWKVFHYINGKYDLHQRCYKISDFKDIFWKYFYYYFSTKFYKRAMSMTAKATVDSVRLEMISDMLIRFPSLPEQEKIWSLFEQLDSHISKNQQKLEKLKNMKLSFLQKLFPKEWSVLPELRFKGFEGAWEERKLGENVEEINRKDEKSTANIMMISANEWFINQSIRYSYDNFWKSLTKYTILRKGELGYNHWASKIRPYGSCFVLKQDEARVPFVYHCFKVKNNNPYFFELTLNSKQVEKKLKKIISSWARMDGLLNISYSAYVDINIVIPSLPEQEKIWAFFEKLDTQITQQTQKIQKLQNLKQSLLEKMFI